MSVKTTIRLSDFMERPDVPARVFDAAIQAAGFIVEDKYVQQSPVNKGGYRQGIQLKRMRALEYVVENTAQNRGRSYPLFLYAGTGRMRGKPDFGFTTGRVRAGDVALGIGGIRPNKVALRAKKESAQPFVNKLQQLIYMHMQK